MLRSRDHAQAAKSYLNCESYCQAGCHKRLEDPSSQHLSLTCCPARHKESFTASRDFSHVFCVMKGDSSCYESCAQEVWHARRLSQEACIAVAPEC